MSIQDRKDSCTLKSPQALRVAVTVACSTAVFAAAGSALADEAKPAPRRDGSIYGGLAIAPLEIGGLQRIHASDWEDFGTGPFEGRIELPLQRGNTSGERFGARVGYHFGSRLPAIAELGVFPGSATLLTLAAGVDVHPLRASFVSFGVTPKLGYLVGLIDAGKAEVLPGKTPPVVTRSGTFDEGDSLSGMFSGAFVQVAASSMIRFNDRFGLRLDVGYQHAWVGNFKVKAGSVELDKDSRALVKPDGSTTQAGLDPKASSSGITALAALAVTF
jgi:hypothetical protein